MATHIVERAKIARLFLKIAQQMSTVIG